MDPDLVFEEIKRLHDFNARWPAAVKPEDQKEFGYNGWFATVDCKSGEHHKCRAKSGYCKCSCHPDREAEGSLELSGASDPDEVYGFYGRSNRHERSGLPSFNRYDREDWSPNRDPEDSDPDFQETDFYGIGSI
jgi:hypothetical protein